MQLEANIMQLEAMFLKLHKSFQSYYKPVAAPTVNQSMNEQYSALREAI